MALLQEACTSVQSAFPAVPRSGPRGAQGNEVLSLGRLIVQGFHQGEQAIHTPPPPIRSERDLDCYMCIKMRLLSLVSSWGKQHEATHIATYCNFQTFLQYDLTCPLPPGCGQHAAGQVLPSEVRTQPSPRLGWQVPDCRTWQSCAGLWEL